MVPHGPADKSEETLFQLLAGARACLDREQVALVGGHSAEGAEVALGFTITGEIAPDRILRKAGLRAGDALILSKDRNRNPVRRLDARPRQGGVDRTGADGMRQSAGARDSAAQGAPP
jgi:selenide,water dikinase